MWATFNRFEIEMTIEQAESMSHQGQCDDDVAAGLRIPRIARQLARISDKNLASELREYGAWSNKELTDRDANLARILWLAAGNIVDGQ